MGRKPTIAELQAQIAALAAEGENLRQENEALKTAKTVKTERIGKKVEVPDKEYVDAFIRTISDLTAQIEAKKAILPSLAEGFYRAKTALREYSAKFADWAKAGKGTQKYRNGNKLLQTAAKAGESLESEVFGLLGLIRTRSQTCDNLYQKDRNLYVPEEIGWIRALGDVTGLRGQILLYQRESDGSVKTDSKGKPKISRDWDLRREAIKKEIWDEIS